MRASDAIMSPQGIILVFGGCSSPRDTMLRISQSLVLVIRISDDQRWAPAWGGRQWPPHGRFRSDVKHTGGC